MDIFIDIFGVRITPKVINFYNCEKDECYVRVVSVQNISSKSVTVRFYAPQTKNFSLIAKTNEKIISAGLSHVCSLRYIMEAEEKIRSSLVITIDGAAHEIEINVFPSAPNLMIPKEVNFGTVVMANKVISRSLEIVNDGMKIGEFKMVYEGNKPLNIVPNEGFVYPQSSTTLQVEYVTREVQEISELCQVYFESQEPFTIKICGEVVKRSLELLDLSTDERKDIKCIQFSHTYYGSDRSEAALLFNNSPEKIQFVAILEEDTVGQESGSHITMTASGINPKECTNSLTSLITMFPNQGSLGPYEKIPVLFRFSPRWKLPKQAFKKTLEPPLLQKFAVFVRIQIVGSGMESESNDESKDAQKDSLAKSQQLEVAVTGTATPVLIGLEPQELSFGPCVEGASKVLTLTVLNNSSNLSCLIDLPRVAHFSIDPKVLRIPPSDKVQLTVTFCPKQIGEFNIQQHIKVLSFVKDPNNPFIEYEEPIHEMFFNLTGSCKPTSVTIGSKYCNGTNPLITNPVGICVDTNYADLGTKHNSGPTAAYITTNAFASGGDKGSSLFKCEDANKHPFNNRTALVAFPNDRTASIRPSEQHKEYRTILTRTKRHNYVDPDYAYEDDEMRKRAEHKDVYETYIRKRHLLKKISTLNSKFELYENDLNLGIIPGNKLTAPKLRIDEVSLTKKEDPVANSALQLLSSKDLKQSDKVMDINKLNTFNAVPSTTIEKAECSVILTPQQLHKIVIGPSTVNFGDVCIKSTSNKEISVVNNLDQFIHISVLVDCKELRQSSPLSQVIPPKTKSTFPLVFESNKKGKFQRNLSFIINGYYQNHVIVLANVVPNQLHLSTDCLFLISSPNQPPDTGIRSTITMTNPLNYATEFLWDPVFHSSGGIAFSIRPKEGVVEAFSKLDCEVVFHSSFPTSSEGDFILRSPGNEENSIEISTKDTSMTDNTPSNSLEPRSNISLHCVVMLGNPHVSLQSRRVMFGSIPVNLTTCRTAVLINTSANHAFFRVVPDDIYEQYPGMIISPLKGSVPVGGQSELTIKYLPKSLLKFDFSVPVVIRGWKEIELKISGAVIIPQVEITQKRLDFGGVAVGSEKIITFTLNNKSQCKALVEFDFSKQKDFSILADETAVEYISRSKEKTLSIHEVLMKPLQTLECKLLFTPKEVAAYDFPLVIRINQINISQIEEQRSQTNFSSNKSKSSSIILNSSSESTEIKSKNLISSNLLRQVTATATRQPISISNNRFSFHFSTKNESQSCFKQLVIYNNMTKSVDLNIKLSCSEWKYGNDKASLKKLSKTRMIPFVISCDNEPCVLSQDINVTLSTLGEAIEMDLSFIPEMQGLYTAKIPVYINNDSSSIFQWIYISGILESARLVCQPESLVFLPAPLVTELNIDFKVVAINFDVATELAVKLPLITRPQTNELYQPFKCSFLTKNEITPLTSRVSMSEIKMRITFSSDVPINIRSMITFTTGCGVSKDVMLNASADNCLLSWQSFIGRHQMEYHIVCDEGKTLEGTEVSLPIGYSDYGEAQLKLLSKATNSVRIVGSNRSLNSRNSTTVTSSNFEESSVTYEETMSESESAYMSTPIPLREGALNNIGEDNRDEKYKSSNTTSIKMQPRSEFNPLTQDESNSDTLDIGSSITLDKESSVQQNDHRELSPDNMSNTNESNIFTDFDIPSSYDPEVTSVIQRWYSMHGWPGNIHPVIIPLNFRTSLQKRFGRLPTSSKDKTAENVDNMENTGLKSDNRDFYDMILYLTGRQILGINTTVSLPTNPIERTCHIYIQHVTLIAFIESQGAQLAQIIPEYLMDVSEYEMWHNAGCPGLVNKDEKPVLLDSSTFEKVSKKSWTTVLLQILKVFILARVNYKGYRHALQVLHTKDHIPEVSVSPYASNCYSVGERIILAWLNYLYDTFRTKIWSGSKGQVGVVSVTPPARWIINFDNDFMDSLILATSMAAYIPFLAESHFKYMYLNPQNPEQCLHNALKIVNALKEIGIEFDIQAIDIVDPNPIMMLMLTFQLFQSLPLYLPKTEILFTGGLHDHVTKHIQISNPTSKPLTYECIIIGNDASDFSSPKGTIVNVSGKSSVKWPIVFTSRFLRCAEALIMFIGRKTGSITANNLIFTAKSKITSNNPSKIEKISGKCYVLKKISLKIISPYNKAGEFKVRLVENSDVSSKQAKEYNEDHKPSLQRKSSLNKKNSLESVKPLNKLRAFFCHTQTITIDESKTGILDLFYLPFHLGIKSCSIIFSHDVIGEFVHYVEATAELPEPIHVFSKPEVHKNDSKSVRISSADAANRGFDGNDNVIYWKCEVGATVNEILSIPLNNSYKENALLAAAQAHLSPQEVSRRKITGTLNSGSLLLTAVHVLTITAIEGTDLTVTKQSKKTVDTKYSNKGNLLDFEIEIDSTYFSAPSRIQIPDSLQYSVNDTTKESNAGIKTVEIPIKFFAASAGVYPCNIVLKGPDDVRLFRIECTVVPEGNSAQLYFKTPLQDILIQNIPIINKTKQDWPLQALITGTSTAFSGPDFIMAKALSVSQYALQFKPTKEGKVNAKLTLYNEADGTEHFFELFGEGESPLALETLTFECIVGETIKRILQIPNSTRKKHVFSVESDLDLMMVGDDSVSVLPGRSSPYELTLTPNTSGEFKGILAFVSGKKKIIEYDSDGDEMEDVFPPDDSDIKDDNNEKSGIYRIWYAIVVNVHRGPSQDTFSIQCHCLQTTCIEIPITNPLKDKKITLKAYIQGPNLTGMSSIDILPYSSSTYYLQYIPSKCGSFDGRLVFFDENIGEFWFKINLVAKPPLETVVPVIDCVLGKWSVVEIPVRNLDPHNKLLIQPEISNPECFSIHIQDLEWFDHEYQCLSIPAASERLLGVRFTPCDIGSRAHKCSLTLKSDMLGDWKFKLTGCGLPPVPCETIGISAEAGSNMTLLIPFHNPLLENVLIDVKVTEKHQSLLEKYKHEVGYDDFDKGDQESTEIFKLLLKNDTKLKLGSKQSFDIPISFAPQEMRKYDGICCVIMKKKSGETIISEEDFIDLVLPNSEVSKAHDQYSLRWLFPIKGIPEASAPCNVFTTPLVQGPLRIESKERVELCLWGLPPPVSGEDFISKKIKSASTNFSETDCLQPLDPLLQEFTTELKVTEVDQNEHIDSKTLNESVKIFLLKESKHIDTGMTVLTFEMLFKPLKKFRLTAQLRVSSTSGGVWLFPIRFVAHECDPDDEIIIEAVGLNKPVSVKFYLNSKTFEPVPFKAFFLKGGDLDFTVSPEEGILPPLVSHVSSAQTGLPFVVTWTPKSYSRCKGARLVIETEKMEWVYRFTGITPQYVVPHSNSMVQSNWSKEIDDERNKKGHQKKNFIKQNLELTCTAVSSPIKGGSLFPKIS